MTNGILIVDDSARIRRIVRSYLTERDFDVCGEAIDGRDAIKKARELKPALILLDVSMPDLNGIEVASIVKDSQPNVRILAFTMHSELLTSKLLASAVGIDGVVAKADGFNKLDESIRALLGS
ncbi:MAG: response regulator transcription factor [Candidatus Acidiferrales bacterium]